MKLTKIIATAAAASLAATTMAAVASAADKTYTANWYYASGDWYAQTDTTTAITEINGDGTYTIKAGWKTVINEETGEDMNPCSWGVTVLVVDIPELGEDLGLDNADGVYDMTKCTFSDVKLVIGGQEIAVDSSKVLWGDPEEKGNLRLEIYNAYGKTTTDGAYDAAVSPINPDDIAVWTENDAETSITFTLTGIDAALNGGDDAGDGNEETSEPEEPTTGDTSKPSTDTGVESVAVVAGVAVLAAGAVVVAKKRK